MKSTTQAPGLLRPRSWRYLYAGQLLLLVCCLIPFVGLTQDVLWGLSSAGGPGGAGTVFSLGSNGQGFEIHKAFGDPPAHPTTSLVQDTGGGFWGVTQSGGIGGRGTVFKMNADGTGFTILKSFSNPDGANPHGSLVKGPDGFYYGLTSGGGQYGYGTMYKIGVDGSGFSVLQNFRMEEGAGPRGSLVWGQDGFFYGLLPMGGAHFYGSVFKIRPDGSGFTIIKVFRGSDGAYPTGSLVRGTDGSFYGATEQGGASFFGTVFRINADGSGFAVLKNFNPTTDGSFANEGLMMGSDGFLYGTTLSGGNNNNGILYKVSTDGTGFAVLRRFSAADGAKPECGVVQGPDDSLYGVTTSGGTRDDGVLYKIRPDGSGFTVLRNFSSATDGRFPIGGLLLGDNGNLYGMAYAGGKNDHGTIYTTSTDGTDFNIINSFENPEGANPRNSLVQGPDGRFFGMTFTGGANGIGTVFRLNRDGTGYTVIKSLTAATDGARPVGNLMVGKDGLLYGMASEGGKNGHGTLFSLGADGSGFRVLRSFSGSDGSYPNGSLMQGTDGALYGMTAYGGSAGMGAVFKLEPDGSGFKLLKSFFGYDGFHPYNSLVEGPDGSLYGITGEDGMSNRQSTLFKIKADGTGFTVLKYFEQQTGYGPRGNPVFGPDGALYGMAGYGGGFNNAGTIYRINTDGSGYTVLRFFSPADGSNPWGSLVLSSDGSFYGITLSNGNHGKGTAFKVNPDGSGFTVIRHFSVADGVERYGSLIIQQNLSVWKGTVSGDWHNPENWSAGVPTEETDALFQAGAPNYPKVAAHAPGPDYTTRDLTVDAGAKLALGTTLHLYGNLKNNGIFTGFSNKTDELYQVLSQVQVHQPVTIRGTNQVDFYRLQLEEGATLTLATDAAVLGTLTLKSDLHTNGKLLTLLSDKNYPVNVENLGGIVTGTATVQRYINKTFNSGTGTRLFASPVVSTTFAAFDAPVFTPIANPAYNSAANPKLVSPYPNIFGYDQVRVSSAAPLTRPFDFGWYSPAASSTVLEQGKGYAVTIPAVVKAAFEGTLNNGDVTVTNLGSGSAKNAGWHLLGNPYPSGLVWSALPKPDGMDKAIYVYRSSGQTSGSYLAYVNGVGNEEANTLTAMQGFFVRVSKGPVDFTFSNSARTISDAAFYRTETDQRPKLQLKLVGDGGLADEMFVYFQEEATAAVNGYFDAYKIITRHEDKPTLFASLFGEALAIKGLPYDNKVHTIPLECSVTEAGSYSFSAALLQNFPAAARVQLLDRHANKRYPMSEGSEFSFDLSPSSDPHRFMLIFSFEEEAAPVESEPEPGFQLLVYPNPSYDDFNLVITGLQDATAKVELELYNVLGQQVLRRQVTVAEAVKGVKLQPFSAGVYQLRVKVAGKTIVVKLLRV